MENKQPRKRIQVLFIDDKTHERRIINILAQIYKLPKREVEKIYWKMERKVKETKMMIHFMYPDLVQA